MACLKCSDVESALKKKGFKYESKRKDHLFYFFYLDGKRTSINTHVSHNEYEIRDPLIKAMSVQMTLEKSQFVDFVECRLTKKMYREHLIANGYVVQN